MGKEGVHRQDNAPRHVRYKKTPVDAGEKEDVGKPLLRGLAGAQIVGTARRPGRAIEVVGYGGQDDAGVKRGAVGA